MRLTILTPLLAALAATPAQAEDYVIDTAHAFVQFRIQHLGYSWLHGRFNTFEGGFSYDENDPAAARVEVTIDTASLDTNHAERDKHLRGGDFLDAGAHPEARFVSTAYSESGDGSARLEGNLTLRGVTRPVTLEVTAIGAGPDPWGGYRRGFHGTATLALADFGIDYDLGPAAREVELELSVEGIRQ
ncbi:MAG: YceI family protein [Gammaproteobacteria bacterium]|nr:YceI family protein [Gammaproteobacteria bacterium]